MLLLDKFCFREEKLKRIEAELRGRLEDATQTIQDKIPFNDTGGWMKVARRVNGGDQRLYKDQVLHTDLSPFPFL